NEKPALLTAAQERFDKRIPPGYKDVGEKAGERAYGDALLWEEILRHAKEAGRPVIFVTEERKEDWWLVHEGARIGPRPELIAEFAVRTEQLFWMYGTEAFLRRSSEHLKRSVSPEVATEVQEFAARRSAEESEERKAVPRTLALQAMERRAARMQ